MILHAEKLLANQIAQESKVPLHTKGFDFTWQTTIDVAGGRELGFIHSGGNGVLRSRSKFSGS